MLPTRCQEAHRLFLKYVAALSDRNRADSELLKVLRTGTGEEFLRARKLSEEAYGGAGQARAEYIRHCEQHSCNHATASARRAGGRVRCRGTQRSQTARIDRQSHKTKAFSLDSQQLLSP